MLKDSNTGQWSLIGIISWGIGCTFLQRFEYIAFFIVSCQKFVAGALPNQPGVYTRITHFSEWIRQIIVFWAAVAPRNEAINHTGAKSSEATVFSLTCLELFKTFEKGQRSCIFLISDSFERFTVLETLTFWNAGRKSSRTSNTAAAFLPLQEYAWHRLFSLHVFT